MLPKVVIVGGGPAGLMCATQLLQSACEIVIIDHKPRVGRKFLVAGDGGFNLTHSEALNDFLKRYDCDWVRNAVSEFTPNDFRKFLHFIGIETRIGSSGKVFPQVGIKPNEVLTAWLDLLDEKVNFLTKTVFVDWSETTLTLKDATGCFHLDFDFLVFGLGGASWKKTGSDGTWLSLFEKKGISVSGFQASNSGVEIPENYRWKNPGDIVKNVRVSLGETDVSGDLVATKYGLEGKPIYAVNRALRFTDSMVIHIDLKPQFSAEKIKQILQNAPNFSVGLRQLNLSQIAVWWIKSTLNKDQFLSLETLVMQIKSFAVPIISFRPLDEVISTVGGVNTAAMDEDGFLINFPSVACVGEMVNWDAPTGGYLLQGCVATGARVGAKIRGLLVNPR